MKLHVSRSLSASYLRNIIFGVEDSLVSTVGLLSGIAIADVPRRTIFLTGVVLIFVEAFSMGAGTYLSESSAEDYLKRRAAALGPNLARGVIMFVSYFISGFVPLFPYAFFSTSTAFPLSVACSMVALSILGLWGGFVAKTPLVRSAVRMAVIGGAAIMVGILAGSVVQGF